MTSLLKPFSGFIPTASYAPRIVGPPSSMMTAEQKNSSKDDALSFRHRVGRGARALHNEALAWLERCNDVNALQYVESAVIVHRLERGSFAATGFIADVSLTAYDTGRIKRHETTIAKTERKMLRYMESTRIFGNPVALAHHNHPEVAVLLSGYTQGSADVEFQAIDGTNHFLWVISGDDALTICQSFDDTLYITDGHHRLAAASSLAAQEDRPNPHLPAALFAEDELRLDAFARAISDDSIVPSEVVAALTQRFDMRQSSEQIPRPSVPHEFGVRVGSQSYVLKIPPSMIPSDTYDKLDVNLLQDLIMEPLFDVTNPRTDSRLEFIADTTRTTHDVDAFDVWFLPYPTSVRDVMTVADTGRAMPPKSTFFMPKVPSGLTIRQIDG